MRYLFVVLAMFLGGLVLPALASEAVLKTASKEVYESSLVEMSRPNNPAFGRKLILSLLSLAARERFPGQSPLQAARAFSADFDLYLEAIAPFDGLTATQILAAADSKPVAP